MPFPIMGAVVAIEGLISLVQAGIRLVGLTDTAVDAAKLAFTKNGQPITKEQAIAELTEAQEVAGRAADNAAERIEERAQDDDADDPDADDDDDDEQ